MKKRILFVCLGNICRSPAAEGIMQHLVDAKGLSESVILDSAGTAGHHRGEPPDLRMQSAANKRGYTLNSRARSIGSRDLTEFNMIIAMDRENFRQVHCLASGPSEHVYLLSDFLGDEWPTDVPDPYYGGEAGFDFVLDMLEAACPNILEAAIKSTKPT